MAEAPAPVSSLRSRFESLVQPPHGAPPSPTTTTTPTHKSRESIGLGRAPGVTSAGRRVASASTNGNEQSEVTAPRSSSAFVNGRGPPPPPPVAPRPHLFSAPPTVGYEPDTQDNDEEASLSVALLRSKFKCVHSVMTYPILRLSNTYL